MAIFRKYQAKSDWIFYKLETKYLDPPELSVQLKHFSPFEAVQTKADVEKSFDPVFLLDLATKAILDWDLTDEKENKLPLSQAREILLTIGGEMVADRKKPLVLCIIEDAGNPDFFFPKSADSVSGITIGENSATGKI